jgi:anti-anti-sigma factor
VIAVAPAGPGGVIATVTGDIDMHTARHLEAALHEALDTYRPHTLTIDMAGVAFLDAAGVTALIRTHEHEHHADIVLTNAQPIVARVFAIVGLMELPRMSG